MNKYNYIILLLSYLSDFKKWKRFIEEKYNCQYVKNTAVKSTHNKQYIYYFCHRSFVPRTLNEVKNVLQNK